MDPHRSPTTSPSPSWASPTLPKQVPDIYDAAKYDAIHNQHLGLELKLVYTVRGGAARDG